MIVSYKGYAVARNSSIFLTYKENQKSCCLPIRSIWAAGFTATVMAFCAPPFVNSTKRFLWLVLPKKQAFLRGMSVESCMECMESEARHWRRDASLATVVWLFLPFPLGLSSWQTFNELPVFSPMALASLIRPAERDSLVTAQGTTLLHFRFRAHCYY